MDWHACSAFLLGVCLDVVMIGFHHDIIVPREERRDLVGHATAMLSGDVPEPNIQCPVLAVI